MLELIDIPFKEFIHVLVRRETSFVGAENIDRLLENYNSRIKSMRSGHADEARKELVFYKTRITVTEELLNLLKYGFNERICAMLREWYPFQLSEESYISDINNIVAECQVALLEYERHLTDFKKLTGYVEGDEEEVSEATEYERYADILNSIRKMPNVGFITMEIDTQSFICLYNDLIALHEKNIIENAKH